MKPITTHWNKLLPVLAALFGGVAGYFGATITLQTQIESLQEEVVALRAVVKDLESIKQISSTALSKANDAITRSTSAHDLATNAVTGVEEAKGTAKHALEMVVKAEAATGEAISRVNTAVVKAISASNASDAAHDIAKSALNEAKLSVANAAQAVQDAHRALTTWPSGIYCILKRGRECPPGFEEGHLHLDTEDDRGNNRWSGLLPAGSYYRNNLDLKFCCK